ncbi:MAG TPA: RagB/SusD family nutrient uptake outer membrane protein, partial [Anseongella sp.]|nr:RagB/SusD family nutrient uptake outer membrane protein [Anseongella sp.]
PEEEIYALILADLQDAVEKLPAPENMARGRASRAAALALLGKVYVYLEDWENALANLERVDEFNYRLLDDFASLWSLANEDNAEVIFAMKYIENENGHLLSSDFIPYFGVEGVASSGLEVALLSWSLQKKYEAEDTRKAVTVAEYWKAPGSSDPEEWRPYVNKYAVPHSGRTSSGLDLPVLRYADIVLLKAEALYRLNRPAEALAELNRVRSRAFGNASHNYSMADISTPEAFLDKLLLERQLELAFENQRWFDLVRTGRFMEALDQVEWNYNPTTGTAQIVDLDPKPHFRYFPIPQHEIDQASPGVLTQNEGY